VPGTPRSPEAPTLDLPELDKADDSEEVDVGGFELSMGDELDVEEGDGALDSFELGIEEQDVPGSDEAASDLDIGMSQLLDSLPDEPPATRESEAPLPLAGDLDLHLDTPLETDDTSSDAELGDDGLEPLPELLSEDVEGDGGSDLERPFLPGAPEGRIPSGPQLEAEWLALGSPCTALWAGDGEVLASAEHLMGFGRERKSVDLPAGSSATSLCLDGHGTAILATSRGLLEVSDARPSSILEAPELMRGSGAEVAELAAAPGTDTLWARLTNGALLRRRRAAWERHEAGGAVRSLSSAGQHITLLVVAKRPTLQLSADGGSSFRERLLPEPAATVALGNAPLAVALASTLAISDSERGLCVSHDGGETFRMVVGAVNVTAVAVGQCRGKVAIFAALYRESRDMTELIVVDPETGAAISAAELAGEADDDAEETGRTSALIWADGYLWAAGGYGLARLR
jgi:hypothetical protein